MNVKQLKEKIKDLPDDMLIVTHYVNCADDSVSIEKLDQEHVYNMKVKCNYDRSLIVPDYSDLIPGLSHVPLNFELIDVLSIWMYAYREGVG